LDLGGKWQLIILYWLADPPWQFGELIADEPVARRRTGPGWIRLSG
jgi:DNA-binding HxlR family transcriptional regulator